MQIQPFLVDRLSKTQKDIEALRNRAHQTEQDLAALQTQADPPSHVDPAPAPVEEIEDFASDEDYQDPSEEGSPRLFRQKKTEG